MRKPIFAAAAVAVAAGLALGGCSAASPSGSGSNQVVHLTYWSGFTGGDSATYKKTIAEFNSTHPKIQVDFQLEPWDTIAQKLPTAIASGSGPDIATPDYNVATIQQYVANGLALPMTSVVGNGAGEVPASAIPKSLLDSVTVKGKIYAMPASFTTLMLYYNTKLLSAAGITAPPTTMTQLQDDAVKLTGGGKYGIAIADNNTIAQWPVLIWADGGDIVNAKGCSALGDSATINAVSTWANLIKTRKITQVGLSGQDADNLFAAGKAAFEIDGPNAAGEFTPAGIDFKLAPVPTGASGSPVTLASTAPTIISAKTKYPKQAQEFMAWWMGKKAQEMISVGAADGPARTDMADDAALKSNPLVQQFSAQVPSSRLFLPTEKDFNSINTNIFQPAIQAASRSGDGTASLKAANTQLNTLLGCS
ncbi:MAG TPA: extracellular solute-binding protein [Galbitalea sp.]|jgi:ABC-type glycerol-3-phosphate transport system substrate-binding protein